MITKEQIHFFEENGYLPYGKVLEKDEVEELRDGLDRVIELELTGGDDASPEFKYGHDRDPDEREQRQERAITQFVNMWKREPAYERLIHHPIIAGVAAAILRTPRVRLWHDQIISKPPGDNGHFRFHQDFYFWPLSEPRIASCWLALDDATVQSGCMHVVPASHRDPRFIPEAQVREDKERAKAATEGREFKSERDVMAEQKAEFGKPVELKAGDCMFHHCLNFHATPPNTTDHQRRAHVMIFMAQGMEVNLAQSANHVLVPTFEVEDGQELVGAGFPASEVSALQALT